MTWLAWLDAMPPIPLATGVPVVWQQGAHRIRGIALRAFGQPGRWDVEWEEPPHQDYGYPTEALVRVNLDDPQGFAYALRWCSMQMGAFWPSMTERWTAGRTTDADRVQLARVCADAMQEVTP